MPAACKSDKEEDAIERSDSQRKVNVKKYGTICQEAKLAHTVPSERIKCL